MYIYIYDMLAGLTFIYNDIHRYGMIHFFARLLLFPACVLRACASLILAVESCGYLWLSKMGPKNHAHHSFGGRHSRNC